MEAAGAELVQGTSRDSLFRPQTLFLRVLRDGGACEDVFTYGQILFYLGEYIKTKGLFDKEQEHVVCCSNDLLGDVFGASSFSMREHRKLSAMIYRNLIAVDPSESISPPELRELESKHKKSVRGLWEEQPSSTVDTRPSTTSGRRSPREREDNMEELPCGQPRSQQKSESSLSLPLGGCGVLSGIWPGEPRESSLRHTGFITSTMESEQELWEKHPSPSVGTGLSSARRPSSETEYSLNESSYGELKKRKKSDSSISFSFGGCGRFSSVGPGESSSRHTAAFPSSPESVQEPWAKYPFPKAGTRPSLLSEGRPPSETEDSVEEIACGQAVEKAKNSLSHPCGEYSARGDRLSEHSGGSPAVALFSSQESEQEPWEEHPSPNMGTERSSSSRRPSSETDEDVEKLPYGQSGNLEKSESEGSISHSIGGCSVRSDVASVQSSGHPSVITTPSSPDNSADAISDQFSVEYEVESMESEDYSPNEEGEELGPALAVQGSQKLAVQEKGTPSLLPQPSTAHDQTGGKPGPGSYSQPPPVRENNPRAVSAMSSYRGLGDSHSSSWRAPSSSLSITEPCIICLSHPKNGCIVHGITGHLVTCYTCARRLQRRDKPCPVCRQPIHLTVLVYLT